MGMNEVEKLIEIYKCLEDAGLMVVAGKKDTAELMVSNDVVPVVRCGKCKYYVENHYGDIVCQHPEQDGDWLEAAWLDTNPDDFCSYGERRAEDGQL